MMTYTVTSTEQLQNGIGHFPRRSAESSRVPSVEGHPAKIFCTVAGFEQLLALLNLSAISDCFPKTTLSGPALF